MLPVDLGGHPLAGKKQVSISLGTQHSPDRLPRKGSQYGKKDQVSTSHQCARSTKRAHTHPKRVDEADSVINTAALIRDGVLVSKKQSSNMAEQGGE